MRTRLDALTTHFKLFFFLTASCSFNRSGIPEERLSLEIDGVVLAPDTRLMSHWLPKGGRVKVSEAASLSECESDQSNHSIIKKDDDLDRISQPQIETEMPVEERELRARLRASEGGYLSLLKEHRELLAEHEDLLREMVYALLIVLIC